MDKKRKKTEIEPQMVLDGISICTVCMNRNHHLIESVPTWLKTEVDEIVIVDWTSALPVKESLAELLSKEDMKRIRIIRVENAHKWVLTVSFNLAIRAAKVFIYFLKNNFSYSSRSINECSSSMRMTR